VARSRLEKLAACPSAAKTSTPSSSSSTLPPGVKAPRRGSDLANQFLQHPRGRQHRPLYCAVLEDSDVTTSSATIDPVAAMARSSKPSDAGRPDSLTRSAPAQSRETSQGGGKGGPPSRHRGGQGAGPPPLREDAKPVASERRSRPRSDRSSGLQSSRKADDEVLKRRGEPRPRDTAKQAQRGGRRVCQERGIHSVVSRRDRSRSGAASRRKIRGDYLHSSALRETGWRASSTPDTSSSTW